MKPEKIGTVWTATCRIQYIDEQAAKWVTVGTCIDTPNATKAALESAAKTHPGKVLWVNSQVNGRYIP